MLNKLFRVLFLATCLSMSFNTSAITVFDNSGFAGLANYATYRLMADDFSFSGSTSITGATLSVVGRDNFSNWDGTAEYYIFSDDNGRPGEVLSTGYGQNISIVDNVNTTFGFYGIVKTMSFDFENQFDGTSSDTYWFGMHLQSDWHTYDYDDAMWVYSASDGNSWYSHLGTMDNWTQNYNGELSFTLEYSPVPVPGAVFLFLSGAGLLSLVRRKTKS